MLVRLALKFACIRGLEPAQLDQYRSFVGAKTPDFAMGIQPSLNLTNDGDPSDACVILI